MKTVSKGCFVTFIILILCGSAHADLPLTVEELLTDKGKVKLDVSFSYANSDRRGVSTGEPITVQTGPTSFVTIHGEVGESQGNSDVLVGTLGLRYGLTSDIEIFTRGNYLWNSTRTSNVSGTGSESDKRFTDAWTGINYQLKKDDDLPAVLFFSETAFVEKNRKKSSNFKSYLSGLTIYKSIDPVVLSLTSAYRLNLKRKDGNANYKPGDMLLINPSIAFAVNDRVTLSSGFQWSNRLADKLDKETQGIRHTSTDLILGAAYGISEGNILNLTFTTNASGSDGADLRLNWLYTF